MHSSAGAACSIALLFAATLCGNKDTPLNAFPLPVGEGTALINWTSASTFRFCRSWQGPECRAGSSHEVEVTREDAGALARFRTRYLTVEIDKATLRMSVWDSSGSKLVEDLVGPRKTADGFVMERSVAPAERFYGLGARDLATADIRGRVIEASVPFLISSAGYGLYAAAEGRYAFDLGHSQPDRYRVTAARTDRVDYYFHYGPSPKEIFEEHKAISGSPDILDPQDFRILSQGQMPDGVIPMPVLYELSWEGLGAGVRLMVHSSLSAILVPAFDITPFRGGPPALFRRALQLAQVTPVAYASPSLSDGTDIPEPEAAAAAVRRRWTPFFISYSDEARLRGLPMLHPLPLQFPKDAEAAKIADEFLVGDEVLVAPVYREDGRRSVYLPMGIWTNWRTNEMLRGRQTIEIMAAPDELPMFAKNGTIVPLAPAEASGRTELHYFPKIGAEFFLFEPEANDYTQLHAGPTVDLWRLEIETKVSRTYEWVVHNLPAPRRIWEGQTEYKRVPVLSNLAPGCWYFDVVKSNIHVAVRAETGQTRIIHLGEK